MLSEVVEWEVRLRPRKEGSMSILMKNIVMPKNCMECPFMALANTTDGRLLEFCSVSEMFVVGIETQKDPKCPLIELPPHGLIDKQMLLRNISENQFTNSYVGHEDEYAFWDKVWDYIINAPTIIESEGEDA